MLCKLPVCGDGFVQGSKGEDCDEGQQNADNAACTSNCREAECGDKLVWQEKEDCDDGNDNNFDACPNDCTKAECGDGELEGYEQCDGKELDGKMCDSFPPSFGEGLACDEDCAFSTKDCDLCILPGDPCDPDIKPGQGVTCCPEGIHGSQSGECKDYGKEGYLCT
jgi:hypothetical protein